jgi:hypothetical protein
MLRSPATYPSNPVEKPFSTVNRAPSGVSPWMGLYSNDTSGGTINNYYSRVRPEMEQRALNRNVNGQLGGLQSKIQRNSQLLQDSQIQQQGIVNPQYFIDYRQYYPGMGQ